MSRLRLRVSAGAGARWALVAVLGACGGAGFGAAADDDRPARRPRRRASTTPGVRGAASSSWPTGRSRPAVTTPATSLLQLRHGLPGQLRLRRQLQRLPDLRHLQPVGAGAEDRRRVPGRPERRVGLREPAVRVGRGDARRRRTARSTPPRRRRRASAASASSTSRTSTRRSRSAACRPAAARTRTRWSRPKNDPNNVYIYVSGTSGTVGQTDRARAAATPARRRNPNPSQWRIEVIKVPLASAGARPRSSTSRACSRTSDGRRQRPAERARRRSTRARVRPRVRRQHQRDQGGSLVAGADTNSCHDITVYEELDLAAGACEGNGLLIDISDPANPGRIDAVADPLFAYWHGATFSNDGKASCSPTSGAAARAARCRATDQLSWGANAIYEIVNRKLVFRSYYKLPVAQTTHRELRQPHPGDSSRSPAATSSSRPGIRAARRWWTSRTRRSRRRSATSTAARSSATTLVLGGYWSTYWYNGTDLRLGARPRLRLVQAHADRRPDAGEIASAERTSSRSQRFNAQSQAAASCGRRRRSGRRWAAPCRRRCR